MKSIAEKIDEAYVKAKAEYPDAILLFRVGDYWEAINDDAGVVAKVLGVARTEVGGRIMAGFPIHCNHYIQKLVKVGHRVATIEEVK